MEVKIGIQNAAREIVIDSAESMDAIEKQVADAVGSDGVLSLADSRGRRILVPAARLAYVEIGGGVSGAVGFRS